MKDIHDISHETTHGPKETPQHEDKDELAPLRYGTPQRLELQYTPIHHTSVPSTGQDILLESVQAPPAHDPGEPEQLVVIEAIPQGPQHQPVRPPHRHPPRTSKHVHPFPPSPFPGMSGIFSPNPGYLVRRRLNIPHLLHVKG